jgi:hypothetical protein
MVMRLKMLADICRFALWLSFCVSGAFASNVDENRTLIHEVLEKYIASQGGRDVLASASTFELKGKLILDSQGLQIPLRQRIQSPDKVEFIQDFPVLGSIRTVINGNQGWEWHPISGERPLDADELQEMLNDANLQRDLNLFDAYKSIQLGKPETIEGINTIHLIFIDNRDREEHWFFKENGDLFQKIHWVASGPESAYESRDRFYDFQTVEGFRFPRTIRFFHPTHEAELRIEELVLNR